ncbi:membrane protein [Gordonia spumicola]|uniref:Membrane protein n=1 Tax=Gordonia spumicola TaxID=589161 RepID=A0A7I9V9T1_9ACTN|nr:membrane protein [Gordonia spumicola]
MEPDGSDEKPAIPRSGPRATYPTEQTASNRKRWFYVLSALVVVAGLGLAYAGYKQFADPDVSGEATAFEILSSDNVAVQYTVNRSDPGQAVACVVRARAQDGSEVGRREVLIPAGTQTQVGARTEVMTSSPAVIGEVFGCTADVPPYLKPAA